MYFQIGLILKKLFLWKGTYLTKEQKTTTVK